MTEAEEQAMYEKMTALRVAPPCRIKLTDRCRGFLNGSVWKKPGDEAEIPVPQSQELCQKGEAEPVGVASWIVAKAKSVIAPAAAVDPEDDWTKRSAARWVKCRVVPGKERTVPTWDGTMWQALKAQSPGRQVYNAKIGMIYAPGAIIFLDSAGARRESGAGNVDLIEPASLPPLPDPANKQTWPMSQFGCSPLAGAPPLRPE